MTLEIKYLVEVGVVLGKRRVRAIGVDPFRTVDPIHVVCGVVCCIVLHCFVCCSMLHQCTVDPMYVVCGVLCMLCVVQ